jgi:hypothetical protein
VRLIRLLEHGLRPRLGLMGLGMALLACGDTELAPAPPPPPSVLDAQAARVPLAPACVEGAVEPCSEVLGEHDGIVSCYAGTRTCQGGSFGACLGGESYEVTRGEATASAAGLRPLALSSAADCTDNPCNSFCREFTEAPPKGLVPDVDESAPPPTSWITGNLSDYPPEWVVIGNQEPCQVAGDCQFDTACTDPSPGSCSHSVCAAGEALAVGCNRCADSVCAQNADCCASAPACAHDPCEVANGGPLDPSCDTCVDAVCDAHPECCSASWDEACVGYVASECAPLGQSCSCPNGGTEAAGRCYVAGADEGDWFFGRDACSVFGDNWGLSEIADASENAVATSLINAKRVTGAWLGGVERAPEAWNWQTESDPFFLNDPSGGVLQAGHTYANWGSGEPALGALDQGISITADGTWRGADINAPLGYLCEGPKNRLGPKRATFDWGPECVELVEQTCGVSCPDAAPLGIGSCIARVPSDRDESCASFDLSLGATCEAAGLPQIPVCNHGQAEAPAGLRLSYLPIGQMGSAAPDLTLAGDCVLTEAIPAGSCVTLTDCPGLSADLALVVNPVDGSADARGECRQDDNWTIYQPLPCRPAVCESHVLDAARVKANDCTIDLENPLTVDPTLASVRIGSSIPVPGCGDDEVRWGASCYFFSRDVATWDDAQGHCRERGAGWDLVALNSPAENAWVRSESDTSADLQIGFNDKDSEGDHVWSNGSCRAFTAWDSATAQPNNTPPGSEQCTRMTVASGGGWEDKACNDDTHPYACEGPVRDARGGCASGQISGPDGKCYAFERGGRPFDTARDRCVAIGTGWQLASVDDETTNDFVTSLIGCTPTWLNNPPGAFANWAPAESVDLSNPPFVDALGFWHATADDEVRATLCQGPATATGAPELEQVASRAACTGEEQFYFEGNETAPESLHLCPLTCEAAAAADQRRIEVEIPCAPPPLPAIETEHTEVYGEVVEGAPPLCPGTTPQWDFLYYDAVTPGDSRIEFEVRTAATPEELTANATEFLPVAVAHAAPTDTQKCESPSQGQCPIDLFHALGDAERQQQVDLLELRVRLVPGSRGEGPIVRDWKVRFSCPPAQ